MTQQLIQRQSQSTVAVEAHLEASLPPSVASSLDAVVDGDYNIVAYTVDGPCPVDDLTAAIAAIDAASQPMPAKALGMLIAEVFSLTKRKKDDQITLDLAVEAYGSRLEQYPADIVHEVLTKWPDQSMWWPSWHELKEEIDWRNRRAKMRDALEKKLTPNRTRSVINQAVKGFKP